MRPTNMNLKTATLFLGASLGLAGCMQTTAPGLKISHTITVKLVGGETKSSLEQRYGGHIVIFNQNLGLALLGLTAEEALLAPAYLDENTIFAKNSSGLSLPEASTTEIGVNANWSGTANSWMTWSGAWVNWSGGWYTWSNAWNAWSSGDSTVPTLPSENRAAFASIRVPQAHALSKKFGEGITVAVIDSGINLNHPMLKDRLSDPSTWADFVGDNPGDGQKDDAYPEDEGTVNDRGYGHGTGVAGIIAQIAPKAKIMPVRVVGKDGSATFVDVAAGVNWAINNGANIINLSLGAQRDATVTDLELGTVSAFVVAASNKKIVTVASAGNNSGSDATYPAMLGSRSAFLADINKPIANLITYDDRYIISVGSFENHSSNKSDFSNGGAGVEIYAPGRDIFSAAPSVVPGGTSGIGKFSGTSFAAPTVAGLLALGFGDTTPTADRAALIGNLLGTTTVSSGKIADGVKFMRNISATRKAMLIVGSVSNLTALDKHLQSKLAELGYKTVVMVENSNVTATSATGNNIVVVAPSSVNGIALKTLVSSTTPLLLLNTKLFSGFKLTSTTSLGLLNASDFNILNNKHPLSAGMLGVLSSGTTQLTGSLLQPGLPHASAVTVATNPNCTSCATIFGYEKGATLADLSTAPARRTGFGFFSNTPNYAGNALLDAAITWTDTGN